MKKRGEIVFDSLIPWLIGAAVIVVAVILFMTLDDKSSGIISRLRSFWRFGS